ncbi:DNA polymerase III subunit gamma and tau [Arthrobacter nitrophenolicus]|uniref:DNA polymerase III subunit gamma and tau n=1 Tax=Arthrobacter nitrophenolicus TaxID=683150 RepID=UPI00389A833A
MSARIGRVFSVTVTTALYRRYRPDSFADVIGQEHVTEPLMTALRKNRVNHAYLFSGPRGCGKTTSARILARCLNCAQGPTDTPCGQCPSCIELARGGSGSLDVIEIDAASHGGVDDARDLRERATFAPVRDRYKIFIIDEAHMVTSAGFNALLKIVEEPPEHIKFIFATTEPDKVIGTIRSRTHHYPFRLVPPEPLMAYLELLCNQENVPVAPGVLSLVIRAGGGSVRDSLSVLDQLMAGAGPNGLDYELAVALLGYTHASLLDDVVEAVAASDAATVFRAVDRVIQTGHDPRRFVEDLLERFRDLIIVKAMPESAHTILRGMPADQIARLQNQAHNLGSAELSRAADVTNTALTEMTGATSPRLHLELLCARILLPTSDQNERGLAARIDRVERRFSYAGNDVDAPAAAAAPVTTAAPAAPAPAPAPAPEESVTPAPRREQPQPVAAVQPAGPESTAVEPRPAVPSPTGQGSPESGGRSPLTPPRVSTNDWPVEGPGQQSTGRQVVERPTSQSPLPERAAPEPPAAARPGAEQRAPESPAPERVPAAAIVAPAADTAPQQAPPAAPPAMGDVEVLRRAWPDVLQTLSRIKRSTWALVEPNAQVSAFDGAVLTLSFTTSGLAGAFGRADHSDNLRQAIHKTVGIDCQINAVAGGASQASSEPNPKAPARPAAAPTSADVAWGLAPAPAPAAPAPASASPGPSAPAPAALAPASASTSPSAPAPASAPASAEQGAPSAASTRTPAPAPSTPVTGAGNTAPTPAPAPGSPAHQAGGRQTAAPSRETPARAAGGRNSYPPLEGDYSYSDDDWGPPRDEDAPPLDEEPPADWEPSAARTVSRTSAVTPEPAYAPAPAAAPAAAAQAAARKPAADTAVQDPWARAVEQAPGVWVVGNESNVGRFPASTAADTPSPAPAPRYEPATAQVPPSIPVSSAGAATEPDWGLATVPGHPDAGQEPSIQQGREFAAPSAADPEGVRAPEYAMAAAAPGAGPATLAPVRQAPAAAPAAVPSKAGAASPAAAPSPGTGTRQSLYQRLSNSPEAEAGRAKAPARAAVAASTYVQDIPSADDETIEESGVFGRAAVERILGGKLIEERSADGSPLPPRY